MKKNNFLYFALAGLFISCVQSNESPINMSIKEFSISNIDSTANEIAISSIISERLTKEELINITYTEKHKRNWNNKFVMYFFLNSPNNPAYATAMYLKDCSNCNAIDPSNNKIDIKLNFKEKDEKVINTLSIPNEINKDLLVIAFYEESWNANSYIVYNDEKKKEATKIMYFKDGGIRNQKLIVESSVLFREISEEFPEDKPHYRIKEELVEYLYTDGKVGYTYPKLK